MADSFRFPERCYNINVGATKNLLEAVLSVGIKPDILIVSSSHVYGNPIYNPIDEKHPLKANSPYSRSRIDQERVALRYNLPVIISRSFNHTGPGQPPDFFCSSLTEQIAEIEAGVKDSLTVGNTMVIRDISDVRDIVRGYLCMLQRGGHKIYNIGSGRGYRIIDIIRTALELADIDNINIIEDRKLLRSSDPEKIVCDYSLLNRDTGWKPMIPLKETLSDMLSYWRKKIG